MLKDCFGANIEIIRILEGKVNKNKINEESALFNYR